MKWPTSILDFLFPKKCIGCGKFGSYVCASCQVGIWEPEISFKPRELDGLICLWAYDGLVKKIIKNAKYNGRFDTLRFLIYNSKFEIQNNLVVVPVPLYKDRLSERGFNQAEVIAKEVSKIHKIPVMNLLTRIKDTGHQTLRNKEERLNAIKGAFALTPNSYRLASEVLLVDDVITTGATLSECAKVLKRAGVNRVYGLVLAR